MVLRDVVTLWVESVFILDRNEGFAIFPDYSTWFSCLFGYFSRVGTGLFLLCSMLLRPSVGLITCRMFFPPSVVPLALSFAGSVTIVVCPAFCCRSLGVNPLASIVTLVCSFPADSDVCLCGCVWSFGCRGLVSVMRFAGLTVCNTSTMARLQCLLCSW